MTRKNGVYVFDTSRLCEKKKSSFAPACHRPTAANSMPSPTAVPASARGIHAGNGVRATTATSAANGSRKNAIRLPAASTSLDHSADSDA